MIHKNRIKEVRLQKGVSQIRLAAESGVYFSTLSRLENGWLEASQVQRRKLARALRCKVGEIFPNATARKTREGISRR